jgi:hypothetical protein
VENGVDAKSRIHDIEQGVDTEGIEIIQNPYDIQNLAFELVKSAQKEIRIVFSTANAFHHQEHVGAMQLLKEAIAQIPAIILIGRGPNFSNFVGLMLSSQGRSKSS